MPRLHGTVRGGDRTYGAIVDAIEAYEAKRRAAWQGTGRQELGKTLRNSLISNYGGASLSHARISLLVEIVCDRPIVRGGRVQFVPTSLGQLVNLERLSALTRSVTTLATRGDSPTSLVRLIGMRVSFRGASRRISADPSCGVVSDRRSD
jgi:hypothetical protein